MADQKKVQENDLHFDRSLHLLYNERGYCGTGIPAGLCRLQKKGHRPDDTDSIFVLNGTELTPAMIWIQELVIVGVAITAFSIGVWKRSYSK